MIGALSVLLVAAIVALTSGTLVFRISIATAYVSLLLLAVTLVIGPVKAFRRERVAVSTDLRRDVGIWTAIVGFAHVAAGLFVHLGGRPWLYFLEPAEERGAGLQGLPLRLDLFGMANDVGLAATLVLGLLLMLSNDLAIRRLGRRRWKSLQRLNYGLFALVVLHAAEYQVLERRTGILVAALALTGMVVIAFQIAGFRATRGARA